jgi:hypothetical protein
VLRAWILYIGEMGRENENLGYYCIDDIQNTVGGL